MKVYISGAITGTTDYMERFARAQRNLEIRGYEVINPALVNSNLPESTTYEQYMEMSLVMLRMCDAICILRNSDKSEGVKRERKVAEDLHLEIIRERY